MVGDGSDGALSGSELQADYVGDNKVQNYGRGGHEN